MINAIFAGESALLAFQRQLDVIGNNVANSNTTGFKSQTVGFADLLYQTLQLGVAPQGNIGGLNPLQKGLGVRVASISTDFTQGTLTPTGDPFNVAISGNGFFVLDNGSDQLFTRDGTFGVNADGFLVHAGTGFFVQRSGTVGEGGAGLPAFQVGGDNRIVIPPIGTAVPGQATANVTLQGNLDAATPIGGSTSSNITIFDSQGNSHVLTLLFTKTAANTWSISGSIPAAEGNVSPNTIGPVTFNLDGSLAGPASGSMTVNITSPTALPPQVINFDLGNIGGFLGLTQLGGGNSAAATNQDGFAAGFLNAFNIGNDGIITGTFSNGQTFPIAQLALAVFPNQGGLLRVGDNFFRVSPASGDPSIGTPLTGGRGSIAGATLEDSNVDLATELARLIITQRSFEVNSDTIRVSSEMLQTAADLIP
ncbi:MAG: flagellar hook protein FlgE [Gemmatales bacterium]|nr:MAG: flagellar hook protein FlgE [Gemmatales bacterium]